MRRLDLVVGPNGSGKTTFVAKYLTQQLPPPVTFVNADEIARQRWPNAASEHAYDAGRIAAETRQRLIDTGRSFVAETVFSHPSKLKLIATAKQAGYVVVLHVLLIPEDLCVLRVAYRVRAGGHPVAEQKIRERYRRLWPLVLAAIPAVDLATVYDNSAISGPYVVAQAHQGLALIPAAWPSWTPAVLRTSRVWG